MRDCPDSFPGEDFALTAGVSSVDRAAESWVRRLEAGLSIEEEVEFADWLSADVRHEVSLRKYQAAWNRFAPAAAMVVADPVQDPNRLVTDTSAIRPAAVADGKEEFVGSRSRYHQWVAPAVGLAAAVTLLLAVFWQQRAPTADAQIVLPALCEQRTLADGSVVELNRGAEVTVHFTDLERRVRIERGEAMFTVAGNPDRPFIVVAGAVEVHAVGTAFNVRFDPGTVEVVVTEGKVRIGASPAAIRGGALPVATSGEPADLTRGGTLLTSGQRALVALSPAAPAPEVTTLTPDEIEARLAWQPKLLDFDNVPLSAIVAEFNRRNPVRFVVRDPIVANRRLTATFRSDNLEGFVWLLESSLEIQAERLNDTEIVLVRE